VTLDELLTEEGALPVGRALAILGAVARQLDGLAAAGGVHGDVAPANIEVDDSGPVRLRPASPAMDRASLTEIGSWSGHLEYVAPERIRGEPPTPAADRYAFAAVAFETLTGEPPYVREDRAAMLYAHLVDPPPAASSVRPELPEALDDPLARGLDKRPERRAESAAAIVSALEAAAGLPASAPPPEPSAEEAPERPARRRGRRRQIAIGALVLAVVGAGAVAGYLFANRDGGEHPVSASTAGPVSAALVARLPPLPARLPLGAVLPDRLAGWTVTAVDPLAANLPLPADYRFEAAQLSRGDDRALALGIGVPPEGDVTGLLQDVERSLDGRPVARVELAHGKGTLRRAGAAHMIAFADRRRVLVAIAASTPAAVAAARALGRAAA
jgi:Protein kinase domain